MGEGARFHNILLDHIRHTTAIVTMTVYLRRHSSPLDLVVDD